MTDAPSLPARHPNLRIKRALSAEETAARTLTAKERLFVAEYMADLNATRAAARAGYSGEGTAWRLMKRPAVAAAMREAMACRAERLELSADLVLSELAAVAFTSLADIAEWGTGEDGQPRLELKDSRDLPPAVRRGIAEIRFRGGGVAIGARAKVAALGLLMRHMGLLGAQEGRQSVGAPLGELARTPDPNAAANKPDHWIDVRGLSFIDADLFARVKAVFGEVNEQARAAGYEPFAAPQAKAAARTWLAGRRR